jgi:hypothetical protein
MGILWGFAPFIAFFVVTRLVSSLAGLAAAFVLALASLVRAWRRGESPKIIDLGSATLFGLLTLFTALARSDWSLGEVRLAVDGGLTAISLVSIAIGQPFTLQYAREQVPRALWSSPIFFRANMTITAVWTLAFAVFTACDALATYVPGVPLLAEIAGTFAAFAGAIWFTRWYPERIRRSVSAPE